MNDERYRPPQADLTVPDSDAGSGVKAVMVGVLADIGGTLLVGLLFGISYGFYLARQGLVAEQILQAIEHIEPFSVLGMLSSLLGLLVSMLAGYLCARIANHSEYKYAAILGVVSCLFGVLIGADFYSLIEVVAVMLVTFAAVLFGTWLHVRRKDYG